MAFLLLCIVFVDSIMLFILAIGCVSFFFTIAFNTLFPYTVEVYVTEIRNLALGVCNMVGDGFGSIVPIMLILAMAIMGRAGPYIVLLAFAILAFLATLKLPRETYGEALS